MKRDDLIRRLRRAGANANAGLHGHLMHEAADALERVADLHQPDALYPDGGGRFCGYCDIAGWPCATMRAIEGDE